VAAAQREIINPFLGNIGVDGKKQEKLEKLKQTTPLHHATVTLPDADCVEFYKAFATENVAEWKKVDRSHDTVLHVAAYQFKPKSTK
jgi:hypothetical protein